MVSSSRHWVEEALIAGIYVAVTFVTMSFSFMNVQFRIAELLMILCLFSSRHLLGVTAGCFLANFLGPIGAADVIFGTLATAAAGFLMIGLKRRLLIALVFPAAVNGLVIGLELHLVYKLPLVLTMAQVFIGEFVVTFVFGWFVYRFIRRNDRLVQLLS